MNSVIYPQKISLQTIVTGLDHVIKSQKCIDFSWSQKGNAFSPVLSKNKPINGCINDAITG